MKSAHRQAEILITGGTGLLGKAVCSLFEKQNIPFVTGTHRKNVPGDHVAFFDMATGGGIREAIAGKKIILHLSSDKKHPDNDVSGTRVLLNELRNLQNRVHLIYISIVGVDRLHLPYFKQKWQIEQDIKNSRLPFSILRATQFHDYIDKLLQSFLKWSVGILPKKIPIQPIEVMPVAEALFHMSKEDPTNNIKNLGGSEVLSFGDAAEAWLKWKTKKSWS